MLANASDTPAYGACAYGAELHSGGSFIGPGGSAMAELTATGPGDIAEPEEVAAEEKADSPKGADLIRALGFWKVVGEDYRTHRKKLLTPGFQSMFVYRFGTWVDTIKFKPIYLPLNLLWHLMYRWVRNFYGIELEKTVQIGRRLELGHQHGIVIHAFATIGDDVLIRHNVTFGMGAEWAPGVGPVIGDRAEFSPGAVIVGNIEIGDDVSVGPNCTVTTNVPSGRILFNPPPRVMPKPENAPPPQAK